MRERYEKKPKRYVEGMARNVDVYINPWRVQSDVFVVVNSRDIKKKTTKTTQERKHAFKVLQTRTINEKETRIKLLEGSY